MTTSRPTTIAQRRRLATGVWLVFAGLYTLTGGGRFMSVDEVSAFQTTRYIATGGEVPIAPSIVTLADARGRQWGTHGPAISLLALPFYAVGDLLERVTPTSWQPSLFGPVLEDAHGVRWGGDARIFAVAFFNAFVTASLLVVFLLLTLQLGYGANVAVGSTLALGLTTLLFAHSKNFFTHSLVALFLLASLYALVAARTIRSRMLTAVAGSLAGAMVLTRVTASLAVPWLAAYVLLASPTAGNGNRRERWVRLAAFCAPLILAGFGVLAFNRYRFGTWLDVGYTHFGGFDTSLLVGLYGHLLSIGRSIVVYSPPLILAVFFMRRFYRDHTAEARVVLGISVTLLVMYSLWFDWSGGLCFGNRFLLPLVPLLSLALPTAFRHLGARQPPFGLISAAILLPIGLWIQLLGLSVNVSFAFSARGFPTPGDPNHHCFSFVDNQLVAHAHALANGNWIDFWLVRMIDGVGWGAAFATALPWLLAMTGGGLLLVVSRQKPMAITE